MKRLSESGRRRRQISLLRGMLTDCALHGLAALDDGRKNADIESEAKQLRSRIAELVELELSALSECSP